VPDQPYTDDDLDTVRAAILKASGDHEDSETFARYALNALAAAGRLAGSRHDSYATGVNRGFAVAVETLRDDARYDRWWSALPQDHPDYGYWSQHPRRQFADYLETVGPWEPTPATPDPRTRPDPADVHAHEPVWSDGWTAGYASGIPEGQRRDVAQLVALADRLDADCAGHGVASAVSPGLRNAADVLTGESWLLKPAREAK
jgi:hypothetical protein